MMMLAGADIGPQLAGGVRPPAEPAHRFELPVDACRLQAAVAAEVLAEMGEVAGGELLERGLVPGEKSRKIAAVAAHGDGRQILAGQRL
jgi:hypothetical protein